MIMGGRKLPELAVMRFIPVRLQRADNRVHRMGREFRFSVPLTIEQHWYQSRNVQNAGGGRRGGKKSVQ